MLYRKAEAIMEYRRQVAMGSDGDDFIVSLLPENEIVFRTKNARALRNLCHQLRWQIAVDTTLSTDDERAWPPTDPYAPMDPR
jgi:hypothetical protein